MLSERSADGRYLCNESGSIGASDGIRIRDQEIGKHANRSETLADQRSSDGFSDPGASAAVSKRRSAVAVDTRWTPMHTYRRSRVPERGRRGPREDSPSSISAPARRLVRRMKRTLVPLAVLVTFAWSASDQTHEQSLNLSIAGRSYPRHFPHFKQDQDQPKDRQIQRVPSAWPMMR